LALASSPRHAQAGTLSSFAERDLVSDIPGKADHTDPNLRNPWGMAFSSSSPFWVADNHTGVATLYDSTGEPFPIGNPRVVTLPRAGDAPTGQVFNGTGAFNNDIFIFASEHGGITGWRLALGNTGELLADNSAVDAIYKGLAIASIGTDAYLYAADFHNGRIDVFPSAGAPSLAGSFTDPNLPSGFAPFNIQNLGGQLYVTYAKQDNPLDAEDDQPGPGNGFVDIFDLNGSLQKRLITMGELNSPWGLAFAPAGFGPFGGDLLVGNFGDGRINAYDPATGQFIDHLDSPQGNPIEIDGLWALTFGNGGNGGSPDKLYFTAGIQGEDHGLFGSLTVPDSGPGTGSLLAFSVIAIVACRTRQGR
jgi:uncharacterized protein (TIGR03118 family)